MRINIKCNVGRFNPSISNHIKHKWIKCSHLGLQTTYLFTTQFPWTNIATFWMPRRTATESTEGPRRLIKLAKGMTFTEEAETSDQERKRSLGPSLSPMGLPVQPVSDTQDKVSGT